MSQAEENLIHHDSLSSASNSKKHHNKNAEQIIDQRSPEEEQLEQHGESDQRRQESSSSPSPSMKGLSRQATQKDETANMNFGQKFRFYMEKVLDNPITQITMGIITIYALFGDDVRTLVTNSSGDPVFWYLNCVCLGAFSVEIIATSICKKGYFNSFFFYLDIISTISLILDIGWISNQIFSQGTAKASNAASLAKAGRASRVGTKAGRVVRIVRLIRLVKLYKLAQQRLQAEAERLQQLENDQNQAQNEEQQPVELANKTLLQKKVNQVIMKNQITKTLQKSPSGRQQSDIKEGDDKLSQKDGIQHQQSSTEQKQSDQIKIIKIQKLPPITITPRQAENANNNGVLISETNDMMPEKRDVKKMAEEVMTINHRRSNSRKKSKSSTMIQRMREEKEKKKKKEKNPDLAESKVGQKLSDLTTQRVIIIVLCIMISIPLFDTGTYSEASTSYDVGLSLIYRNFPSNVALTQASMQLYLSFHNDERNPILSVQLNQITNSCCQNYPNAIFNDKRDNVDDLRNEDKYYYTSNYDGELQGYAVSDLRDDNKINAILSIVRTIFVSVVLSTAAILFSSDVETLVLNPIESMMKKVRRIAENPLEAAQIEEQEALALDQLAANGKVKELQKIKEQEGYETVVLEKLIIKIGALLALGFGEAGSEIIASNMSKGGDVDPMLPGKKIVAIFGFCDIRNFTDATEVLQTGVMLFVNEIAEIAHSTVDAFLGQSNKNIGDAFLLVWKYPDNEYGPNSQGVLELKDTKRVHNFADLPVIAFLKIMASLTVSKKLQKYRNHKGLNERLKNYRVKMGFGLHVGWAIEGAIGSSFKIDASYLSPNVNMASRLEAATKQFGTGLLVSGHLFNVLSKKCQTHLRHIDRVTVKGSIEPLDMYTVDVHLDNIVDKKVGKDRFDNAHLSLSIKKKHRVIERLKRNKLKDAINAGKETPADWFEKDKELVAMREFFTKEFYQEWTQGFDHYIGGRWPQAKAIFEKTLVMLKGNGIIDGPSNTLLEVIQESGGKAPSDWKGYRALTEK